MNDIFEQMRKDFDVFMTRAENLIGKYKAEEYSHSVFVDSDDIGKLCRFWDDNIFNFVDGILENISEEEGNGCPYLLEDGHWHKNCRRLKPEEVAEITGYKVEE